MSTLVRVIAALGLVLAAWLMRGSRSREEPVRARIVRLAVKHPWLTTGAMAAGAIVIAALMVVSGVVPIKASTGHWPLTAAFLDFAKTRSVWTHSLGIDAPPLDAEFLVLRGAGHYHNACAPCHGGPARRIPPVMAAMTPPPPELASRIQRWAPEELFSIVKHGIKFTGMPAWPFQQREDEIWAMVAFLRRLPDLDDTAYRRLAFGELTVNDASLIAAGGGEEPPPEAVRTVCWRCHGTDGTGRGSGAFPSLAGQHAEYVYASLRAFREGSRFSAIMAVVAANLTDPAMREIASYYERLPVRDSVDVGEHGASAARGQTIAAQGILQRDIPACMECHGPTAHPKNPAYPRLTAQHERYLISQLSLMQERRRGGSPNVNLMHVFVNRLRPDEIADVAQYYAALPNVANSPASPLR